MKKMLILLGFVAFINGATAVDLTTTIEFTAPTIPKIEKPACVKVELISTEKVTPKWTSNDAEPLKLTYLITFHKDCQGIITLISVYDSRNNHHTETIKKTYKLAEGILHEMTP